MQYCTVCKKENNKFDYMYIIKMNSVCKKKSCIKIHTDIRNNIWYVDVIDVTE